ncbi:MAG: XTP/dITP diphosphatase [Clostridia bacterium]|nr:XTP/dITP diphosphatase [Clostridia bacterium]
MDIVLSSHNKKKISELDTLMTAAGFKNINVFSLSDIGYNNEIVEDGDSFEANAMIKAKAPHKDGIITVADDSGLCVDALDGAPGIYSARYSGDEANEELNNEKLLSELNGKDDRSAKFVSVIACIMPDGEAFTVRGECHGIILDSPRGENGFGYDPLFFVPCFDKTFAELTPEEKNSISHRGVAMRAFADELKKRIYG